MKMHRARDFLFPAAAAALAALFSMPAGAQVDVNQPIAIKTLKPKRAKFEGRVMRMTPEAITVRGRENELAVRTFTYSPKVAPQMRKIFDRGGYQFGDKVTVEFQPGSDVALKIKGKPSKPV